METNNQNSKKYLRTGIIGTVVAAICCFTPLLAGLFIAVGLTGLVGGIDYVVFPVMFASLGLVAYALYLRDGAQGKSPKPIIVVLVVGFSILLIGLQFHYALRISIAAVALVAAYGIYLRFSTTESAP